MIVPLLFQVLSSRVTLPLTVIVPVVFNAPAPLIVPLLKVHAPPKVKSFGKFNVPPARLIVPAPVKLVPVFKLRVPPAKASVWPAATT